MVKVVERLGFFHLVHGHREPIAALEAALEQLLLQELAGSLIVLPETFNLGCPYRGSDLDGSYLATEPFLAALATLARRIDATFVVGVLERVRNHRLPYNSAFLVSPDRESVLLSRKRTGDQRNFYRSVDGVIGENPIEYGGLCIATAICDDYVFLYHGVVADRLAASSAPRLVLCIPAAMSEGTLTFSVPSTAPWPGKYAVLANANATGCGSFIKNRSGEKRPSYPLAGQTGANTVMLRSWDTLD